MLLYLKNKEVLGAAVTEPVLVKSLVTISSSMKTTDVNVNIKNPSMGQKIVVTPEPKVDATYTGGNGCANAPAATFGLGDVCSLPSKDTLGIKLIWVAKEARKQGIATKLIDCARKSFTYGFVVKKEHVAFSQPTDDGLALALRYTKKMTSGDIVNYTSEIWLTKYLRKVWRFLFICWHLTLKLDPCLSPAWAARKKTECDHRGADPALEPVASDTCQSIAPA